MSLGRLIEQLLAVPEGEGWLFHQEIGIVDSVFPPFTMVSLDTRPNGGDYGRIVYKSVFDPCMVPNAINITASYYGNRVFTGNVTGYAMQEGMDFFVFMSYAQPTRIQITNLTNVNQYVRMASMFLNIKVEDDLVKLRDICERMNGPDAATLARLISQELRRPS